jgi:hypothetical protein
MSDRIEIVRRALEAAHEMRVDEVLSYNTADAYYRFGSFPPVRGIEAIRKNLYDTHLDIMKSLKVEVLQTWEFGDTVIFEMLIRITRIDDRVVELPCVDVIRLSPDDKLRDTRVYIDPAPLMEGLSLPNAPGR